METAGAHPKRVLVIDDEASVCELLCTYLELDGFEAISAGNARDASELFHRGQFDLITLDFRMQGLDGGDLHRILSRSFGYGQPVSCVVPQRLPPILIVSGCTDDPCVEALARQEGVAGVLQKPIGRDQFLQSVRGILANVEQRQQQRAKAVARLAGSVMRRM